MKDQPNFGFVIGDVVRYMRRLSELSFTHSDLTLSQARALIYLARHQGIKQVELAELLDMSPITIAKLIEILEASGLVEKRKDPDDRRAIRLFLTPEALPVIEGFDDDMLSIFTMAFRGLDDKEISLLIGQLMRIRTNLEQACLAIKQQR